MNEMWSRRLIRFAALFGVVGAVLGSHMAGAGAPAFRPVHPHLLVVGGVSGECDEMCGRLLIRIVALFALVGAVLGSHMAGAGSPAFRPVHAHILVVGWLSVFSWGIYYKVYRSKAKKLITAQGWTGMIGAAGLSIGLWLQYLQPFGDSKAIILPIYIGGGVVLLISFFLFLIITFMGEEKEAA